MSSSGKKTDNNQLIKTKLVYHQDWAITEQEKYIYQYNNAKLPKLAANQISIHGIKLYQYDDSFVISALLRSSLTKPINLEVIDLVVVDKNDKPIARKSFEMDLFGELPSNSSMPWRFLFEKEHHLTKTIPTKNWKLYFELKSKGPKKLTLDLDESWKESISDEQENYLNKVIESLPALKEGEVNFTGLEANYEPEKGIVATMLIRNGSNRSINIETLPLVIEDASQQIVANGSFDLNLEVQAYTCKPWTFVFPAETLKGDQFDLSKWKAYMPNS